MIGSSISKALPLTGPPLSWLGRGVLPPVGAEISGCGHLYTTHIHLPPFLKGSAKTEVIFNQQDRIFDIIGEAGERRSYLFDEEDAIDFRSDDFGFLNETVLRSEDYGDVNYIQTITGHPFTIEPNDLTDPSYQSVFFSSEPRLVELDLELVVDLILVHTYHLESVHPERLAVDITLKDILSLNLTLDILILYLLMLSKVVVAMVVIPPDDSSEDLVFQYLSSNGTWAGIWKNLLCQFFLQYFKHIIQQPYLLRQEITVRDLEHALFSQITFIILVELFLIFVLDHWGVKNIRFQELTTGTGLSEDDFGLISVDVTTKAATGRMPFGGGAAESFIKGNYTGSVGNKQPAKTGWYCN